MENQFSFKGMKRYDSLIKTVCCVDDYDQLNDREWEGCLGVAIVVSVMEGTPANKNMIARYLDIPPHDNNFTMAFERLRVNGVFSSKFDVSKDEALNGDIKGHKFRTGAELGREAWCFIAGIASGFTGII